MPAKFQSDWKTTNLPGTFETFASYDKASYDNETAPGGATNFSTPCKNAVSGTDLYIMAEIILELKNKYKINLGNPEFYLQHALSTVIHLHDQHDKNKLIKTYPAHYIKSTQQPLKSRPAQWTMATGGGFIESQWQKFTGNREFSWCQLYRY